MSRLSAAEPCSTNRSAYCPVGWAFLPVARCWTRVGTRSRRSAQRPGAALLMTIVCLMVIATLAVSLARTLVAEHRQSRWRGNQLQAFWLAESAVERAAARLAASPKYTGEDWQVELPVSGAAVQARAAIRVESIAGQPPQRRIVVEARCPAEGETSVLEVRESVVLVGPAEGTP